MISLEKIFICQARSLNDRINVVQLHRLLKNKDGSSLDSKLCSELVNHFGYGGLVNIDDFDQIWTLLHKRKTQFKQLSRGKSVLTPEAFMRILENVAGQKIPTWFLKQIMRFYNGTISLDVFVHSLHHIREMSGHLDFTESVFTKVLLKVFSNL